MSKSGAKRVHGWFDLQIISQSTFWYESWNETYITAHIMFNDKMVDSVFMKCYTKLQCL